MISISIIIPYFNRENTIDRCIDSVLAASHGPVELVIVDDCSTVPLKDFDHPAIRVLRLDRNMGPIAARAQGALQARHDFLMFLDSDDELLPDWYAVFCAQVEQAPQFDVYGFPDEKYSRQEHFEIVGLDQYWQWVPSLTRASDYLITMRTQAYREVPMPMVRISEIWYIVQTFERGLRARYSDRPLFRYHQDSGNQLSRQRIFNFDTSRYARESVQYAVGVFNRNGPQMRTFARAYHAAWFRRLVKEALLALSPTALARVLWGRHAGR